MRNQLAARSTVGTSRRHTRSKTCRSYRRAALSYLTRWQIDFRYVRRNLVPSSPSQRSRQHGFSLCSDTKAKTTRYQLGELWTRQWGLHLKDMRISWRWTWFVIITLPWTHLHTLTHTHTHVAASIVIIFMGHFIIWHHVWHDTNYSTMRM